MQHAETAPIERTLDGAEDVEALAGLRETPLSQLAPDRVKAVAGRVKALDRRRAKVSVARFNSSGT